MNGEDELSIVLCSWSQIISAVLVFLALYELTILVLLGVAS